MFALKHTSSSEMQRNYSISCGLFVRLKIQVYKHLKQGFFFLQFDWHWLAGGLLCWDVTRKTSHALWASVCWSTGHDYLPCQAQQSAPGLLQPRALSRGDFSTQWTEVSDQPVWAALPWSAIHTQSVWPASPVCIHSDDLHTELVFDNAEECSSSCGKGELAGRHGWASNLRLL